MEMISSINPTGDISNIDDSRYQMFVATRYATNKRSSSNISPIG